jgi:hypothetical protein
LLYIHTFLSAFSIFIPSYFDADIQAFSNTFMSIWYIVRRLTWITCPFEQTEIIYLGQLRHPNLVRLFGFCIEGDHRLLVYEFMQRGSLNNHLFQSRISCNHSYVSWHVNLVLIACFLSSRKRLFSSLEYKDENHAWLCKRCRVSSQPKESDHLSRFQVI